MVLSEESRPKTAFVSLFGKWEFQRCPFGLAQAPALFSKIAEQSPIRSYIRFQLFA